VDRHGALSFRHDHDRRRLGRRRQLAAGRRLRRAIVEESRIVIVPGRRYYALSDLLQGMTPQAMREAFDWGPDQGRENAE
jgi:antitoxin component of MazEF toxin-antitoxin module